MKFEDHIIDQSAAKTSFRIHLTTRPRALEKYGVETDTQQSLLFTWANDWYRTSCWVPELETACLVFRIGVIEKQDLDHATG